MSHWQGNHPSSPTWGYQYPPAGPGGPPPCPTRPPQHNHGSHRGPNVSVEVLIAVLASVCVMLLTRALPAPTPELALVGMVLGAAIPPFVSTAGRRRGLRVTMAVLVTIVAVGVTYTGTIVVDTVTQGETLPHSNVLADIHTPPPPPDGLLTVTPGVLNCTPDCEGPVTIRNTGETRLVIEDIDIDGEDANSFSLDENCVGIELNDRGTCEFTVAFHPNGTDGKATAILLISNSLTEKGAAVSLAGHSPTLEVDLAIAASDVRCTYEATATEGSDGSVTVTYSVIVTGTDESGDVTVTVSSNSGSSDTTTVSVGEGTHEAAQALPAGGEDSAADHMIKINVDPANKIPEADESNNDVEANCAA